MPSAKSLENLKKGKKFGSSDGIAPDVAQLRSAEKRKKNNTLRKLGLQLLSASPEVGEATILNLKRLGLNTDNPDLQTLILARIGNMAIGKDARIALQAAQMLLEITGTDARSMIAAEDQEIQRERLRLERDRFEFEKNQRHSDSGKEKTNEIVSAIIKAVEAVE